MKRISLVPKCLGIQELRKLSKVFTCHFWNCERSHCLLFTFSFKPLHSSGQILCHSDLMDSISFSLFGPSLQCSSFFPLRWHLFLASIVDISANCLWLFLRYVQAPLTKLRGAFVFNYLKLGLSAEDSRQASGAVFLHISSITYHCFCPDMS